MNWNLPDGYTSPDNRAELEQRYAAGKRDFPNSDLSDEGHGCTLAETRIDFWTRVEKFLERSIGKAQ